jgi:protein-S-isoprenylcysteine O-methyltransferase Ste14
MMTTQDLSILLTIITGFLMPIVVEWLKQPRWQGTKYNTWIAFGSAFVLAVLTMLVKDAFLSDHATSIYSIFTDVVSVVGIACTNYELWFKNTALKDWLSKIGWFQVTQYKDTDVAIEEGDV